MSASCCNTPEVTQATPPGYKRVLVIALVVNLSMFFVEIVAGWGAGSVSLLADAVDFLGDAGNYAISLFVLGMGLAARAKTALFKGLTMAAYGLFVLGQAGWNAWTGVEPAAATMGMIGTLALVANLSVAAILYAYREGDANMRSVWLCTRNDVVGNLAVLLAAVGVFGTGTAWPDLVVATLMAVLGISSARIVIQQSVKELRETGHVAHA